MKMLSAWIENASGQDIRVFEYSDPSDSRNHAVRITNGVPSVRFRAASPAHPDELNWAPGEKTPNNKYWCDTMAKGFGYLLPEEGLFVIKYDDDAFNIGPEGSDSNGFPSTLAEASRYTTLAIAEEKLRDLLLPDGTGARIVRVCDLDLGTPMLAESASVPESNLPSPSA